MLSSWWHQNCCYLVFPPEPRTMVVKLLKANLTVTQVRYTLIHFTVNPLDKSFFTPNLTSMKF